MMSKTVAQIVGVCTVAGTAAVMMGRTKVEAIAWTGEPSNVMEPREEYKQQHEQTPQRHTAYTPRDQQTWSNFQLQQEARTVDPRKPSMSQSGYQQLKAQRELGDELTMGDRILSASNKALQRVQFQMQPLTRFRQHIQGSHYDPAGLGPQKEVHTYCAHLNEDCWQSVIYDSDQADARLIGIEYMISPRLYARLSTEERAMWHQHTIEVREGTMDAPLLPPGARDAVLSDLSVAYGKTFYFWHPERGQRFPTGRPTLFQNDMDAVRRAGVVSAN